MGNVHVTFILSALRSKLVGLIVVSRRMDQSGKPLSRAARGFLHLVNRLSNVSYTYFRVSMFVGFTAQIHIGSGICGIIRQNGNNRFPSNGSRGMFVKEQTASWFLT